MSVVLYHFGVPALGGGFVGVDIFFVISGFLIGGILWRELSTTGQLSLTRFYTRRIRRLAPAFAVMALLTFGVGWAVLLPFEFREFGKGLIAATLYLANIIFYRQSGYFDTSAEDKVFLHTWSLSVEEQFYIVLPLLLLVFARRQTVVPIALAGVFAASLIANIIVTPDNQTATFYLFQYRAWELLAGVLLAIYGRKSAMRSPYFAWVSWLGLCLVLASIMFITPARGFPGYQAIFPVAGAVMILLNGKHDNLVNRLLSSPVPVAIGLISYSLYLWHWPVLVLSRYYRDGYSGPLESSMWIGVSVGLAWLSWRYVERPFRRSAVLPTRVVFSGAAVVSVTLVAMGAGVFFTHGVPARFSAETRVHIAATGDFLQDFSRCAVSRSGPLAGIEICPVGPRDKAPQVLIWGDSHLRAYYEGIAQIAREKEVPAIVIWHAGCPPLFGIEKQETAATPTEDAACTTANKTMRAAMSKLPSIRRVLLVGRWAYYAQGSGIGRDFSNKITLSGGSFDQAATDTIAELRAYFDQIYVLRQTPEIPQYDSRDISRRLAHGGLGQSGISDALMSVSRDDLQARSDAADAPFRALEGDALTFLDPWPFLCGATRCAAIRDGTGMYFDNNHITNSAARALRQVFLPVFQGLGE